MSGFVGTLRWQRARNAVDEYLLKLVPRSGRLRARVGYRLLRGLRGAVLHGLAFLHKGLEQLSAFLLGLCKRSKPGQPDFVAESLDRRD